MAVDFKTLLGDNYTDELASVLGGIEGKLLLNDGSYIPKTRFDEVNTKLRSLETQVDKERENNLTAEERLAEAISQAEDKANQYLIKSNKLEVEKVFVKAGINDYETYIDNIVGKDKEASLQIAEKIVGSVQKALATTTAELEKLKLTQTPKPQSGGHTDVKNEKLNWTELSELKVSDPEAYDHYVSNNE